MKRFLFALIFMIITSGVFGQQDIPKIGLVDTDRIIETYYQDSKAMRELKKLRETILEERRMIEDEILDLKSQKLDAEKRNDRINVARLDKLIVEKERHFKEFTQVRNEEFKIRQESAVNDTFLNDIYDAIKYIAISEGYSIVLEKQNPFLLHYVLDIDITDKVLRYLQDQAGQN